MVRALLLSSLLALAACASAPTLPEPKAHYPEPPAGLMQPPLQMKVIDEKRIN